MPTIDKNKTERTLNNPTRRLHMEAKLKLQTRIAMHYFLGGKNGSIGVPRFSQQVTRIWHAAANDDPYADFFLLSIHQAILATTKKFEEIEKNYQEKIKRESCLTCESVQAEKPFVATLRFATPYGFLAARLIGDFDRVASLLLFAQHIGITLEKPMGELLREIGGLLNKVLGRCTQWKETGVTRLDMHKKALLSETAIQAMGILPDDILQASHRSPIAPEIKKKDLTVGVLNDSNHQDKAMEPL